MARRRFSNATGRCAKRAYASTKSGVNDMTITIRAKRVLGGLLRCIPMLLLCLFPCVLWAGGARVLLICSYHPDFPTFPQQVHGLRGVLAPAGVALDLEFMDTKRLPVDEAGEHFLEHLRFKLSRLPAYDVIVTADDAALHFALDNRDELFPGSPLVFLGVNDHNLAHDLSGTPRCTGVIEAVSMRATLDVIGRLLPRAGAVHAVVDAQPGGQGDLTTFLGLKDDFPGLRLDVLSLADMTWEELGARLAGLPREDAVLLLSAYGDRNHQAKSFDEGMRFVLEHSGLPVFHLWEHGLGAGLVGGKIISHLEQGRIAGNLVLQILSGTPASFIPVVEGEDANRHVFDHAVLARFGLDASRLPEDSEIRGVPVSVFTQYGPEIFVAASFLCTLALLAAALLRQVVRLRRAKGRIAESEVRYKALFDANADGILVADTASRTFVFANPAACRMFGYSAEELCRLGVSDIHPRESLGQILADFDLQAHGQKEIVEGIPCLRRDGGLFYADVRSFTLEIDSRPCAVGLFRDVTERGQVLEAMRQAEERLALAVAGSNEGIWDWDRVADTVYFSPRWKEIIGYADHELSNHLDEWSSRIHPEDRERVLAVNNEFSTSDDTHFIVEYRLLHKDGTYRWILGRGTCLRDAEGKPYRMAGSHADITERKAMEQDLIKARDEALAANRSKGEFLANMSHEIRTPLNGVLGMLQLLEGLNLSFEQRQYIAMAASSARRLTGLLSDILDLSRIESGRLVMDSRPFSLLELFQTTHGIFSMPTRDKGVRFEISIGPGLPETLVGDELRLRQILFNIVGNAVKFTAEGFVRVDVSSLGQGPDGRWRLLFCVEDSGPGIDDGIIADVFEPFSQGEEDFVRQHQGAGLGLAIVKRLLLMMDGSLAVDTSSAGSTICFSMPFAVGEIRVSETEETYPAGSHSLKILLAEDDAISVFAVRRILEKQGHSVTTAGDGLQALEELRREHCDLILMDVQMPNVDGVQATRLIREDESLGGKRKVPIVAMTAYAMSGDREKFLEAGMNDYVAKPVSVHELERVISRIAPAVADKV